MIKHRKPYPGFTIRCNLCGQQEIVLVMEFMEAIQKIKDMGWWIIPDPSHERGKWHHHCPQCFIEANLDNKTKEGG